MRSRYLTSQVKKDLGRKQVSATGIKDYQSPEGIRVAPALELLSTLV